MDELGPDQRDQLGALSEAYHARYGVAVEWLKHAVGAGAEYSNAVAHAVVSGNGAWCECVDLPMEFTGVAGGPVPQYLVDDEQALQILDALHQRSQAGALPRDAGFSLFVLYARAGIVDGRGVYARHWAGPAARSGRAAPVRDIGEFRPGVVPLFFRCRTEAGLSAGGIDLARGVLFFIAYAGDKHLLVSLPHGGQRSVDLGADDAQVPQ